MSILLIIVHIIVCVALIMIVLLQTGKGADMGAAFGGGSSQTLFGSTGASTFLSKATTVAAVVFMVTCMTLAYLSTNRTSSSIVLDGAPAGEKAAETDVKGTPAEEKTAETDVKTTPAGEKTVETDVKATPVGEKAAETDVKETPAEATSPAGPASPSEPATGEQPAKSDKSDS